MTLHPISVVNRVIDEYESYLLTEFRARDPKLREALQEALKQPRFLAQEPFFHAHRPFKDGKDWTDLGLDPRLAAVMKKRTDGHPSYLHQGQAIEALLGRDTKALVVTTGTGSGKTEAFLMPVIQNAIEDSIRFKRSGLTAILVYPMNALANDQEERIRQYLEESGHTHVKVARYDRSTRQSDRESLRRNPPHLLLTNYMMLEYLLVRPADREDLFANHRCRFVVLDEVHSYRGSLGANIALLVRRLKAHLAAARQDWRLEDEDRARRFPDLVAVGTSATLKSIDETGLTRQQITDLRDEAVQEFFGRLTGVEPASIRVVGEESRHVDIPPEARWTAEPVVVDPPDPQRPLEVAVALRKLAGVEAGSDLAQAANKAAILWKLGALLSRRPLSVTQIVDDILQTVPERSCADRSRVEIEVLAALVAGAALPDSTPGALRLRTHRFIRGGWSFHRCVNPDCGKLFPFPKEQCDECGGFTAPLYVCRSCGAHVLRFKGDKNDPQQGPLLPNDDRGSEGEWLCYYERNVNEEEDQFETEEDDRQRPKKQREQMKSRPVKHGSLDWRTLLFSENPDRYPVSVTLAPARNSCLVCGGTAGPNSILSPVGLGTSAAVRVLCEGLVEGLADENHRKAKSEYDGKDRLLVFADSRQDAAHQARFITYAGRYDRMRRRLLRVLDDGAPMPLNKVVQELMLSGHQRKDNEELLESRDVDPDFLAPALQTRARCWEEAPLLDDLAVSARYRATVFNLGLVGVRYHRLAELIEKYGSALAEELGLDRPRLAHLCRCVLDEMRTRTALSRPMLTYHPSNPSVPDEFRSARWERRWKTPAGYAFEEATGPLGHMDKDLIPSGVKLNNAWRREKGGGSAPGLQRKFERLLDAMGGVKPSEEQILKVLGLLRKGSLLVPVKLHGHTKSVTLIQVNEETVLLQKVGEGERFHCEICGSTMPWVPKEVACPNCGGVFIPWSDDEVRQNRYVERILKHDTPPLVAAEHTAQVTGEQRSQLEERFKAPPEVSPLNVLACSPTLEMGIDVGGLDAVVMRNVPPRPDNYAQRGGRAGRRSRVGIVLGYARSTPHDGYFYDKPQEMIAGEVPAPAIGLGNRDVVTRHLNAICMGLASPGLAGRMKEYVELEGTLKSEAVEELVAAFESRQEEAVRIALAAWEPEILAPAGMDGRDALLSILKMQSGQIRSLFDNVVYQIRNLTDEIDRWQATGQGQRRAIGSMELKKRLLGIPADAHKGGHEADDRSAGHPMRRFAEFGILPGYEFPSEPATVRLLKDDFEEEPISVARRFGLGQYVPGTKVHARGQKWKVVGLDPSSPWNPKSDEPDWYYQVCTACHLRFDGQSSTCPRCHDSNLSGESRPAYKFGGFLAVRDDTSVLEEEDRFGVRSLLCWYPQWDGNVAGRFHMPCGWNGVLRKGETLRWLNEWKPPSAAETQRRAPRLSKNERGFYICPSCGKDLEVPEDLSENPKKGTKNPNRAGDKDPYGHRPDCPRKGQPPKPLGITYDAEVSTFRLLVVLPSDLDEARYEEWGYSLGYALRIGLKHLYMLDGSEVEFLLEPQRKVSSQNFTHWEGCLTFVDAAVGGSGFLERMASELHLVARKALEHLEGHERDCDRACYRCLKSYTNQRHHEHLNWVTILDDLDALASGAPELLPVRVGDTFDPRLWLEAYEAGVGSPLELKFLRLFEKEGLTVEKQFPIAFAGRSSAATIADFAIPEGRIAIYVDGAAFHQGQNLRKDRFIREKLARPENGWKVVTLTAKDLGSLSIERILA